MQAGARHYVPPRRHLSTFMAALVPFAALACSAMLPSAAQAAAASGPEPQALGTVQATATEATAPVSDAARDAVDGIQPSSGSGLRRPDAQGGGQPVQETIAPIAHAAGASVPPQAAVATPRQHLAERPGHRISHVTASSSSERMSSGRIVHGHD